MSEPLKLSLAKAVVSILRPMIRLLIRFEFTHAELSELVRQTYVEIADSDYSIVGEEMTVSRVAVLTGLSRKEVVRLRTLLAENTTSMKQAPNRAQRVMQGWLHDRLFLDKNKNPRILSIKGPKASFVELCKRYSGDITYGAVLEELNRVGVTEQPDEYTVKLVNKAYIPHVDDLEQVRILSLCVSDLFKTAVRNISTEGEEKRFQRQVTYNRLDKHTAEEFRLYSADKATDLLEELNDFLSKRKSKLAKTRKDTSMRVGMGIYYIEDSQSSVDTAKKKTRKL